MPGSRAKKVVRSAEDQARGTARNSREVVSDFTLDQILPGSIAGFIQEVFATIPYAFGRGSAKKQIYASIVMIFISILATPFTLGWSLALALPFAITLSIGIWRLVPGINSVFQRARGNRLRDRDVPLWKRD